ncbi:ABC transporter ATP-binding protein/permease [Companilactobacillus allii]|uniref:Multidrug ABC transporter ATP-binding protein n=1 Tax=Companilactobacillus allii TaxID=1847728 RepID=A0A1P8Q5R3_9LACO|nr:ABC transporter ATP-binding protein [Companilactobacillus allii]APX73196.1 multidrug ABC transporter ATP-binding protein [Companilactobacillus allii]USQ68003.1 ABC transporter ATP-binding protein/permease [Companilactobacillus allii]
MAENKRQSIWARSMPVKEQLTVIKRLISYAKPFKWYFIITIILSGTISLVNIYLPKILQIFIDKYLRVGKADINIMWFFAGLYLFGMLTRAVMQFFQNYTSTMGAEYMLESVRREMFTKLHKMGMRYFDQVPGGSILSRLTNDTMSFSNFWALFNTLFTAFFAVITSFLAMYFTDRKISLWLLIFMPFLGVVIWYYQRYSSKVYRRMRERLSELNTKLSEAITGISVIQQFRQEHRINDEFDTTNNAYFKTRQAMIRTNSLLLSPIIDLFYALGTVMVLGVFGIRGLDGYVAAGMVYAFVTYLDNFYNPLTRMMDNLSDFQDGIVAGSRVLKVMDDQTMAPTQHPVEGLKITEGKIEFKHVTFAYDGVNPVLKDVSFVAKPGQTIALVGQTGSGKTSTINVLMRFYEFQSGEILIDDRDIREYPTAELRKKFGLVLQEPFMFYGDINSNIRMFDESISDEQVRDAAKFVMADDFINNLPQNYRSRVIERGASYSSGQRQLISFARTIVTDPKILILDEATANVDTETEEMIQTGLQKIQENRTTIAIAHRLSTIQNADLILVLNQGKIVERGDNEELMKQRGYYYDMIQLQNTDDKDNK